MKYDRAYFRMVGLALLPALGVSVLVVLAGQVLLNFPEQAVDRVSQVLFVAIFFAACHHFRPPSHSHGERNPHLRQ